MPDDVAAVLDSFRRLVQAVRASSIQAKRRLGISGAQLFVLRTIADRGPCPLTTVAATTATHPSTASLVVTALIQRRLVERRASSQDRRQVVLTVTATGTRLLRRAPHPKQERLIAATRSLSRGDRRALTRGLAALSKAMRLPASGAAAMLFEAEESGTPKRAPERHARPIATARPTRRGR